MKVQLDTIERRVVAALTTLHETCEVRSGDSKGWTRAIKDAVGDLGESLGYEVWAAESKFEHRGEWQFDLGWFQVDGELVIDVPLILESEWNMNGVLEDFQKLLVSRAKHNVMVFEASTSERWEATVDGLLLQVSRYAASATGDRYLFWGWITSSEEFRLRHHVVGGLTEICS